MLIKILSITYTDEAIRHSEVVYFDGSDLNSMTAYLADDYIEERNIYPTNKARDSVNKRSCRTVTKGGIIYGKVNPEYEGYLFTNDFIVKNGHLRYVKKHSGEILELLGDKKKK